MGKGGISQLQFGEICDLCIHISRGKARTRKNQRDPLMSRINKSIVGTIRRVELGNLLDNFKIDIFGSLSEQINTLKIQNKQKAGNITLSILCPKCRKKHALRECHLDLKSVETCVICAKDHDTK